MHRSPEVQKPGSKEPGFFAILLEGGNMFDGRSLPLHPAVLLAIYLPLMLAGSIVGQFNDLMALILSLPLATIHCLWCLKASLYALHAGNRRGDGNQVAARILKLKRCIVLLVAFMALAILITLLGNTAPPWLGLIGVPGAISFFGFIWFTAKIIDEAEMAPGSPDALLGPLGTFLQLVYLFIGAFFVYRRLKRLNALP